MNMEKKVAIPVENGKLCAAVCTRTFHLNSAT